jgi:hypothetical protein
VSYCTLSYFLVIILSNNTVNPWPQPPERIAKHWPDGFPADGSKEFNELAYKWGTSVSQSISRIIERELSTIDLYEIVRHSRTILREYFSGSYNLGPYEEISYRYFLGVFGYFPEEVIDKLDGPYEERMKTTRELLHRLHAKAHHE